MFSFQHSQITQDEFDKLAKQLIKYSTVYARSKFDIGKLVHHYTFHKTCRSFQKTKSK